MSFKGSAKHNLLQPLTAAELIIRQRTNLIAEAQILLRLIERSHETIAFDPVL